MAGRRGVLRDLPAVVRRLGRRRGRRPPRCARPPGPPGLARRGRGVVQPVLRLAVPGRRLRRLRLPQDRAAVRHATTTWSRSSRPPASAGSGSCSTWSPGTPRPSTSGSGTPPPSTRRPLHLVGPARRTVRALARPAPRLLPEELLRQQPALNFGYARTGPGRALAASRSTPPGRRPTGQALREIIAFWLDRGVSGFRVDMAYSLVKDDPGFAATAGLWREIRDWMHDGVPGGGAAAGERRPAPARHRRARRLRRRLLPGHPRRAQRAVQQRRRRHAVLAARPRALLLRRRRRRRGRAGPFLGCWDEHQRGGRRRPAGRPRLRRSRLLPAGHRRRGPGSSSAWRSRSCSPGARCRPSTTATRSACATCPACRTRRAASTTRPTTAAAAAARCSGTTPGPTPGSRPRRPTGSTCRRTRRRTGRPSPPSGTTRTRR